MGSGWPAGVRWGVQAAGSWLAAPTWDEGAKLARGGAEGIWPASPTPIEVLGTRQGPGSGWLAAAVHVIATLHSTVWLLGFYICRLLFIYIGYLLYRFSSTQQIFENLMCSTVHGNSTCASESKSFFKILTYRIPSLKSHIE